GVEPRLSVEAPLFLFLLGAFALGLIVGGTATWLSQGKWRRTARAGAREARDLRRQTSRLEKELEGLHSAPPRGRLPAREGWGRGRVKGGRVGGPDWHRVAPARALLSRRTLIREQSQWR